MPRPSLKTETRKNTGTLLSRHMRDEGRVPAVLYGKGEPTSHLTVDRRALESAIRTGARMFDLEVGGKVQVSFMREIQRDAIEEVILHVDFHHVNMNETLRAKIPLHFKGTPVGTTEGGVVTQLAHDITVECLPNDLPEAIDVPIAHLKLDQGLHLKEIPLPPKVKAIGEPEALLLIVQKPKEEVPAEGAAAEGDAKEPELIRKERAADDEEAEGEAKKGGGTAEAKKPEDKKK